ncbi:MAG: hypothetical protein A2V83_02565 [Nitrospirae bacterium RBG_16_64_22]|nr:MAG: hypothetical protein A2V83_02565 [Nitrospirae bacterium RBG_16_64_22]
MKHTIAALVVVAGFAWGVSAWAQPPAEQPSHPGMMGRGMGMMGGMGAMRGGADWKESLSKEQREKLDGMHLKLMKEMVPLKDAKNAKKNELNLLVVAEKPNKSAITKKVAEVADISRRLTEKKTLHHLEVREMLTPEQRLKFDMHLLRQGAIGHGDRARGGMGPGMMGGMMGQH